MTRAHAHRRPWWDIGYLALMLAALTADHLFVPAVGVKVKLGYFLVLGLWVFAPAAMWAAARGAIAQMPRWPLWVLLPLAVSSALSFNLRGSVLWLAWLGFDLLTVLTVYAFASARRLGIDDVQYAAAGAVGLVAAGGLVQFVAIFVAGVPILDPQVHLGVYRLNGLAGWPHFLGIYAFLLLPLALAGPMRWPIVVAVALLFFVLAMSTAKIAWVLLAAFACLLVVFGRARRLVVPVLLASALAVAGLFVPLPAREGPPMSGADRVARFAAGALESTSIADRVLIGTMGLTVWRAYPWFGVGPRAYETYVWKRFDRDLPGVNKLDIHGMVAAKHENIWIELLAETGVFATLGIIVLLVYALRVPRWHFENALHAGTWMALVLYFAISGQLSQTGLLTLVYAVFGIYFYARRAAEAAPALQVTAGG